MSARRAGEVRVRGQPSARTLCLYRAATRTLTPALSHGEREPDAYNHAAGKVSQSVRLWLRAPA